MELPEPAFAHVAGLACQKRPVGRRNTEFGNLSGKLHGKCGCLRTVSVLTAGIELPQSACVGFAGGATQTTSSWELDKLIHEFLAPNHRET